MFLHELVSPKSLYNATLYNVFVFQKLNSAPNRAQIFLGNEWYNRLSVPTSPNYHAKTLTLNVIVLRGGVSGKWLGHEDIGYMIEIRNLIK